MYNMTGLEVVQNFTSRNLGKKSRTKIKKIELKKYHHGIYQIKAYINTNRMVKELSEYDSRLDI